MNKMNQIECVPVIPPHQIIAVLSFTVLQNMRVCMCIIIIIIISIIIIIVIGIVIGIISMSNSGEINQE